MLRMLTTAVLMVPAIAIGAPESTGAVGYLDNGAVRIGINLELGGAITYLSRSGSDVNLINSHDWGRQIQMSHYSGPVPFTPNGKQPRPSWAGLGWNPIQSGDCFGNRSRVVEHRNDGSELYVKCIPMQWPLDNEPGECTFECWIGLEGSVVNVRSRMVNNRSDKTQYSGRGQELPATYTNGPWYRLVTYTGDRPFSGGETTTIAPQFPWASWQATENWAALVDESGFGVGIYEPGVYHFIGGFAGTPGAGGPKDAPTGYIAPLHSEIIDWNIDYDYRYSLVLGTIDEIRATVCDLGSAPAPPSWRFSQDRQHFTYVNATDSGWPIRGELDVLLEGEDPQLIGPEALWMADEAPRLYIEAALTGADAEAQVFWSRSDAPGFSQERSVTFRLTADGEHRITGVDLCRSPEYRGCITSLRFDPAPGGTPGQRVRVRSIGFAGPQ